MTTKAISWLMVVAVTSFLATACGFESKSSVLVPTAPSGSATTGGGATSTPSYVGTWASQTLPSLPSASTCGNFQWTVTSQSANSLAGNFSAVCAGNLTVTGSATGQLNGTTIPMTATGAATAPGLPSCGFSLTGTGNVLDDNSIQINYSGTTCAGPVHGTETLHRAAPAPAPTPAPTPTPTPAPAPVADPLFGCGGLTGDKPALVTCIHDAINPTDAPSDFEVAKRVAWALRGEGAGLLIKNGGENIVSWQGYSFSASRICYPDGHIFKIISDAGPGGANGASWQDNGFVDPSLYVAAIDPTR